MKMIMSTVMKLRKLMKGIQKCKVMKTIMTMEMILSMSQFHEDNVITMKLV